MTNSFIYFVGTLILLLNLFGKCTYCLTSKISRSIRTLSSNKNKAPSQHSFLSNNNQKRPFAEETSNRRQLLFHYPLIVSTVVSSTCVLPTTCHANSPQTQTPSIASSTSLETDFKTAAFGKQEYTNSIMASRDTNISPAEVYDSISSSFLLHSLQEAQKQNRIPTAWDVGSGAGVSTQVLWNMGFRNIVAIDWSSLAWDSNVMDQGYCPPTVSFYDVDDETYVSNLWNKSNQKLYFDVIVFNFAINESKAQQYAKEMLLPHSGRLLAPVNIQSDYWLRQVYRVYDSQGHVLWNATDVGAWSVLFQPDVTQDTCQGIWCAPYNGFQKGKR